MRRSPPLARAAELDPASARFAYVHGVALHSAGRPREAFDALRALARHPADREILLMLALIARDAGATALARSYAQRMLDADPEDQVARQMLASMPRSR